MTRISEVIVVEGKYDKNALSQVVEAPIVTLDGFAAFRDREKIAFLRRLAERRGLVILTDSDGAGFVLRNFLKGAIPPQYVKHAYIPDVFGKERRKRVAGKEGKLGVEGMRPEILLDALRRAGATFPDESPQAKSGGTPQASGGRTPITAADLYEWGLNGSDGSAARRKALQKRLNLPEKLSSRALLDALNLLYSREELRETLQSLDME